MNGKAFVREFGRGISELVKRPVVIVPSLILGIVLFGMSTFGASVAPQFQTTQSNVLWTVGVALVTFVCVALMLNLTILLVERKELTKGFGWTWVHGFLGIVVLSTCSFLLGRVAHYGAFAIGRVFRLELGAATFVFLLMYFILLVGGLIWLTFVNFFIALRGENIVNAVRSSARFVRKHYLETLSLTVVFFVLYYFIGFVPGYFGDLLLYVVVVPLFVSVLVHMVRKGSKA